MLPEEEQIVVAKPQTTRLQALQLADNVRGDEYHTDTFHKSQI